MENCLDCASLENVLSIFCVLDIVLAIGLFVVLSENRQYKEKEKMRDLKVKIIEEIMGDKNDNK